MLKRFKSSHYRRSGEYLGNKAKKEEEQKHLSEVHEKSSEVVYASIRLDELRVSDRPILKACFELQFQTETDPFKKKTIICEGEGLLVGFFTDVGLCCAMNLPLFILPSPYRTKPLMGVLPFDSNMYEVTYATVREFLDPMDDKDRIHPVSHLYVSGLRE